MDVEGAVLNLKRVGKRGVFRKVLSLLYIEREMCKDRIGLAELGALAGADQECEGALADRTKPIPEALGGCLHPRIPSRR